MRGRGFIPLIPPVPQDLEDRVASLEQLTRGLGIGQELTVGSLYALGRVDAARFAEVRVATRFPPGSLGGQLEGAVNNLAGSAGVIFCPPETYPIADDYTVPSTVHLIAGRGAIFEVATGKTLTIEGTFAGDLSQHFNCVGTGAVSFASGTIEWVETEWFGAKGDDSTDCTTAIDKAFASYPARHFNRGAYRYDGKLTTAACAGGVVSGEGMDVSIIRFVDDTVSALVEVTGLELWSWRLKDIRLIGPGKAAGTDVHGLHIHTNTYAPFRIGIERVIVEGVSGNGFYIPDWFSSWMDDCSAEHIGGNGFEVEGQQHIRFLGCGEFNDDIDGWAFWCYNGRPFIQGINTGDCVNGLRFGRASGHPLGAAYCYPTLLGVNIEPFSDTGIQFEEGSNFAFGNGIVMYAKASTAVNYGIRWIYPTHTGILGSVLFEAKAGGSYTEMFYVDNAAARIVYLAAKGIRPDVGGSGAAWFIPLAVPIVADKDGDGDFDPLTAVAWENSTKSGSGTVDMNAVFGVPAAATAVLLELGGQDATVGTTFSVAAKSTTAKKFPYIVQIANVWRTLHVTVPIAADGTIYYIFSAALDFFNMRVAGWYV